MGEIIKFDFLNKKKIVDNEKESEALNEEERDAFKKNFEENGEFFASFIEFTVSEKGKKLLDLKTTSFSSSQIEETVHNYSNKEILSWLENSDETEFQAKPSFFRAVFEEGRKRLEEFRPLYEKYKKDLSE